MTIPAYPTGSDSGAARARARARQLFLAAARDETLLNSAAQLHCLRAAETLAVDWIDTGAMAMARSAARTAPADDLIRAGLKVLGDLNLDAFADPRINTAAGHALRALRGARQG